MIFSPPPRTNFSLPAMTEAFTKIRDKFQLDESNSKLFAVWLRNYSGMADVSQLNSDNSIIWQVGNTLKIHPSDADKAYEKAIVKSFKLCDYALENLEGILTASELIELLEWVN